MKTCYSFLILLSQLVLCDCTPADMLAAHYEPGGPENIRIEKYPVPEPNEREVLIEVHYSAINRADTLQRKGLYSPPPGASKILGLEAAGVVSKIGDGCDGKWKIGDRVMALLPGGGNAEYVTSHEELIMAVPDALSMKQAAAIPEVWLTAYQIMFTVGKLQADEYVLIHAGASGVGTAAVQLASKVASAKPIVTAGSEAKIEVAKSLGARAGYNYKTQKFGDEIQKLTDGKGVDLILDCVSTSMYEENMKSAAVGGRWVVYGTMGKGKLNEDILSSVLRKWLTITGTTIRTRSIEYKKNVIEGFSRQALPLICDGSMQVVIDSEFPLARLADAHQYMEDNKNTGKIVIKVKDAPHTEL